MTTVFGIGDTVFWQTQDGVRYGTVDGILPNQHGIRVFGDDRYHHVFYPVDVTKIDTFEVGDVVHVNGHHGIVERVNNSWRELTVDFEIGSSGTVSRIVRQYRAQKVG